MYESDNIEEDVTRSNFAFLLNHNLDIRGSMGLFPEKPRTSEISAIEPHDTTRPYLYSKSSSSSVFERLVIDSNRRSFANRKISDHRLMLELEYENSFLSQAKLTKSNEEQLISRLVCDTNRRQNNYEAIEKLKKTQELESCEKKTWPVEKTNALINRLAADCRTRQSERENVKKSIVESEIKQLQRIRQEKHPRRKLDEEVLKRVTSSVSPECKHRKKSPGKPLKVTGSPAKIEKIVERLHKKSPLRLHLPYGSEEMDDYLMKLKAKGLQSHRLTPHK